jgi:signal transduction histidine kinase
MSLLLTEIRERIDDISSDLQSLSHELHSSQLEYLGIVTASRSFCRDFAVSQNIEIEFRDDDIPTPVSRDVSLCLFRVLQEALYNAVKHSKARHLEVRLSYSESQLHLMIADNGVGFDLESARASGRLGLTSMRERVRLVNGTISIDSKPACGTTIHVRVPLEPQQQLRKAV